MFKVVDWFSRAFAYVAMAVLIFIMFFITVSVFGRYFFNMPIPDDIVIMQALLVVLVFLPFAYVQQEKAHLSVSILTDRMGPQGQHFCDMLGLAVGMVFLGIVAAASFGDAWTSYIDESIFEGPLEVPEWPARGSVFLGTGLLLLKLFTDFIKGLIEGPSDVQVPHMPDH
ncbi:MAG: TRAP transporter small permease [Sneathiella sp.]